MSEPSEAPAVRVEVAVRVDLAALATWPPETADALLAGIARVVSAQAQAKLDGDPMHAAARRLHAR